MTPDKLVIRNAPTIEQPPFAVTQIDGETGRDVAWFFSVRDAMDYAQWKNKQANKKWKK